MKDLRNPLIDILEDFDKQSNGIYMLSAQTGIGKTYCVVQNIVEQYNRPILNIFEQKPKYIYSVHLTSLRDDMLVELKKYLSDEQAYIICLKSFDDSFKDMLEELLFESKIAFQNFEEKIIDENICKKIVQKATQDLTIRFPSNDKKNIDKNIFKEFEDAFSNILKAYAEVLRSKNIPIYTKEDKQAKIEDYNCLKSFFTQKLNIIFKSHYLIQNKPGSFLFDKVAFLNDFYKNRNTKIFKWVLAMFPSYLASYADIIVGTHDKFYKPINDIAYGKRQITKMEYYQKGNYTFYYDEANKGFDKILKNQIELYAESEKSQRSITQKIFNILKNLEDNNCGYNFEIRALFNKKISKIQESYSILQCLKDSYKNLEETVKHPLWTIHFSEKTQTEIFETSSIQTISLHQSPEKYVLIENKLLQCYELIERVKLKSKATGILTIIDYLNAQEAFINSFCYHFFYNIMPNYVECHPNFIAGYSNKDIKFLDAVFHGYVGDKCFMEIVHSLLSNLNICDVKYNPTKPEPLEDVLINFIKCQMARKVGIGKSGGISYKESYPQTIEIVKNINDETIFIYLRKMEMAPEDWLGNLALKSRVCVISATNSDPSIRNFNHSWLSERVRYYSPPKVLSKKYKQYKKRSSKI